MTIFNSKTLKPLLCILSLGLLAALAPALGQGSAERTVTITYDANGDPVHPDTGPFIFSPYELVVERGASQVPINLVIVSEGFSFPDDTGQAVNFDPDDGNFKVLGLGPNNQRLMLMDFNRVEMTYKYGVVIIQNESGQEFAIDPRIKNGGDGTPE